jgi:hypothetical protein
MPRLRHDQSELLREHDHARPHEAAACARLEPAASFAR